MQVSVNLAMSAGYETWPQKSCPNPGPRARRSDAAVGEQYVELGVALVHSGLHAAAQPSVPCLEAVAQRDAVQTGAAVAELLEGHRLQRDRVRHALPGERLYEPVRA